MTEESANLEDNLPMVNYIMLHRIYDLLSIISNHLDSEKTNKMIQYHEDGYLLGPSPSYNPEIESKNE